MPIALLLGCGESPRSTAPGEALYYTDPTEQQRLKSALQRAKIPFEVRNGVEGREEIWYESRVKAQVARVQDEVFGVPPPMGRSISLGAERNASFVGELKRRNATFWRVEYQDLEFIAWPPESDQAADSALEALPLSSQHLGAMKEMRKAADADLRNRTNRSSRSREERAPAER